MCVRARLAPPAGGVDACCVCADGVVGVAVVTTLLLLGLVAGVLAFLWKRGKIPM